MKWLKSHFDSPPAPVTSTEQFAGYNLLVFTLTGSRSQRDEVRNRITKTIMPQYRFLSYVDLREETVLRYWVKP